MPLLGAASPSVCEVSSGCIADVTGKLRLGCCCDGGRTDMFTLETTGEGGRQDLPRCAWGAAKSAILEGPRSAGGTTNQQK